MTLIAHPVGHVTELREGSRLVATVPQPEDAAAITRAAVAETHLVSLGLILADGGPALSADEAVQRAQALVDEVRTLRILEAELRRQRDAFAAPAGEF